MNIQKIILIILLVIFQHATSMERELSIQLNLLPDDIISEIIFWAAHAKANEIREQIESEQAANELKDDETYDISCTYNYKEAKIKAHFFAFHEALINFSSVSTKFNYQTLISKYIKQQELQLQILFKLLILNSNNSLSKEPNKFYLELLLKNKIKPEIEQNCQQCKCIVKQHPHFVQGRGKGYIDKPTFWSPLHWVVYGNPELISLFLLHGADINKTDNTGVTPLHLVIMNPMSTYDTYIAVQTLLEHGADPHIQDVNGKKPINYTNKHLIKEPLETYMDKTS